MGMEKVCNGVFCEDNDAMVVVMGMNEDDNGGFGYKDDEVKDSSTLFSGTMV